MGRRSEPLIHVCPGCGARKEWFADRLPYGLCHSCRHAQPKYRAKKQAWKKEYRFNRYGLDEPAVLKWVTQQHGCCAICQKKLGKMFHIDHDHACCAGEKSCGACVRGLLCGNCNWGLGQFKDNPNILKRAVDYLQGTI